MPVVTANGAFQLAGGLLAAFAVTGLFARFAGQSANSAWVSGGMARGVFMGTGALSILLPLLAIGVILMYLGTRTAEQARAEVAGAFQWIQTEAQWVGIIVVALFTFVVAIGALDLNLIAMLNLYSAHGPSILFDGSMPNEMKKVLFAAILSFIVARRYVVQGGPGIYGRNFVMPLIIVGGLAMLVFDKEAAWLIAFEKSMGAEFLQYAWVQRVLALAIPVALVIWIWLSERVPPQARPVAAALEARHFLFSTYQRQLTPADEEQVRAGIPLFPVPPVPGHAAPVPPPIPVAAAAPGAHAHGAHGAGGHGWLGVVRTLLIAITVIVVAGMLFGTWNFRAVVNAATPAATVLPDGVVKKTIVLRGKAHRSAFVNLGNVCAGYARAEWTGDPEVMVLTTQDPNHGVPATSEVVTTDNLVAFKGDDGRQIFITCYRLPK
jgi:hypothetical protein